MTIADRLPNIKEMDFNNKEWSKWSIATYKALHNIASKLLKDRDKRIAELEVDKVKEQTTILELDKEIAALKQENLDLLAKARPMNEELAELKVKCEDLNDMLFTRDAYIKDTKEEITWLREGLEKIKEHQRMVTKELAPYSTIFTIAQRTLKRRLTWGKRTE